MAKPKKREWTTTTDGVVVCFASETFDCVVVDNITSPLATVAEPTPAHDRELIRATEEINNILKPILEENHKHRNYEKRHLGLMVTHKGLLLAWMQEGFRGSEEEEEVARVLKLD